MLSVVQLMILWSTYAEIFLSFQIRVMKFCISQALISLSSFRTKMKMMFSINHLPKKKSSGQLTQATLLLNREFQTEPNLEEKITIDKWSIITIIKNNNIMSLKVKM